MHERVDPSLSEGVAQLLLEGEPSIHATVALMRIKTQGRRRLADMMSAKVTIPGMSRVEVRELAKKSQVLTSIKDVVVAVRRLKGSGYGGNWTREQSSTPSII